MNLLLLWKTLTQPTSRANNEYGAKLETFSKNKLEFLQTTGIIEGLDSSGVFWQY